MSPLGGGGTMSGGEDTGGLSPIGTPTVTPTTTTTTTITTTPTATATARAAGGGGGGTQQFPVRVLGGGGNPMPTPGPALPVPAGCVVEVYPIPDNAAMAYTALGPEMAKNGPRAYHPASGSVVMYNVSNLAEIWVFGSVNDGVLMRIRRQGDR